MPKPKFTIGADPEITLLQNKVPFAAFNIFKGTKIEPTPLTEKGFYYLWDNVNAEFLVPPASSLKEFSSNIKKGIDLLGKVCPKCEFSTAASMEFPKNELKDKRAQEFGCDPDFNAWTLAVNEPPMDPAGLRSAGGHVHIGSDKIKDVILLVRALDIFLGVPSVLLDPDTRRRSLYGKAGCFREKEYGVEYRTLSNFWIFKDNFHKFVYRGVQKALEFHLTKKANILIDDETIGAAVQHIINNSDRNLATDHVKLWGIKMP
jgi:hypothetical protein